LAVDLLTGYCMRCSEAIVDLCVSTSFELRIVVEVVKSPLDFVCTHEIFGPKG